MKLLALKPTLYRFDDFAHFAKEFEICENDLIFTEKPIFDPYIKPLALNANVMLKDDFGPGEPSSLMIDKIFQALSGIGYTRVIAVGGGSVVDIAKLPVLKNAAKTTELFACEAIGIILKGYRILLDVGADSRGEYIEQFLIASNYAGIAFGNAGVGAVHAMSYPLGGNYHVAHGEDNYQFFTEVFKAYHAIEPNGKIAALEELLADCSHAPKGADVYEHLDTALGRLLPKKPLREYGMKPEETADFARSVMTGQQRLLSNNYVPLSEAQVCGIYEKLY